MGNNMKSVRLPCKILIAGIDSLQWEREQILINTEWMHSALLDHNDANPYSLESLRNIARCSYNTVGTAKQLSLGEWVLLSYQTCRGMTLIALWRTAASNFEFEQNIEKTLPHSNNFSQGCRISSLGWPVILLVQRSTFRSCACRELILHRRIYSTGFLLL